MLTSLLPGLREARSDLVSGVLIVGSIWLLAGNWLSRVLYDDAEAVLREAIDFAGSAGSLVVLVAGAYLLGSLWGAALPHLRARMWDHYIERHKVPFVDAPRVLRPMTPPAVSRLAERVAAEVKKAAVDPGSEGEHLELLTKQVVIESIYVGPQLLSKSPDAYGEHIRLKTDGELRDAVCLPLAAVAVLVLIRSDASLPVASALAVVALAICTAIFFHARVLTSWANSQLAYFVGDGTISTATLDRIKDSSGGDLELIVVRGKTR